jgi:hypothetical protein
VSVVVVEWCKEPDVPVTVMAYVPGGVPLLTLLLPLPPQAIPKIKPAIRTLVSATAESFPRSFCSEPTATPATRAINGNQSALNGLKPEPEGKVVAVAPVVLTVRVAGVPGGMELGLIEHLGADAGDGCTEQERVTDLLNGSRGVTYTVEIDDAPGLTVLGVSAEEVSEKSGLISNIFPKVVG